MPKQGLTEIVVVMDKSGSMSDIRDDAMGSFNTFLDEQKKEPGEAKFTLTLFNTNYDIVHKRKDISEVPNLTYGTYTTAGFTALLDAVGRTIDEVGKRLADTPEDERPERVLVAIITDGKENSSREYSYPAVTEKIKHQTEKYQWEFVFLAAGMDAAKEATSIGIKAANIVGFEAGNAQAYKCSVQSLSKNVGSYRRGLMPDWQSKHDCSDA